MNKQATLKIQGTLNDFIDESSRRDQPIVLEFMLNPSAKDLIEAQGIPHTAVFNLLVNDEERPLSYNVKAGDSLNLLPFELVDPKQLESIFIRPSQFIADDNLGKLSKTMRLMGLDTKSADKTDEIIEISNREKRIILTRNIELLRNGKTRYGYWIRNTEPEKQIEEIFDRFNLSGDIDPFSRCMKCNGILEETPLSTIKEKVPPKVQEWLSIFYQCSKCGQVYWEGSHYEELKEKVDKLRSISS